MQANTNDAFLTLAELYRFVRKRVSFLAASKGKKQTPYINKTALPNLDFRIFPNNK